MVSSITEGTGGGDYTPEDMVWETYPKGPNPVTERDINIEYTNTNDVPLYVQLFINSATEGQQYLDVMIDDKPHGSLGSRNIAGQTGSYTTSLFIVPAGKTYKFYNTDSATSDFNNILWNEARMPVAVGTGGKTVALQTGESSAPFPTIGNTWNIIKHENVSGNGSEYYDSSTGCFKPTVAGWYQVSVSAMAFGTVEGDVLFTGIRNTIESENNYAREAMSVHVGPRLPIATLSDLVYFNGTTDEILHGGAIDGAKSDNAILNASNVTYLSAVLVSGGSASGDSIWTEEDGKAVYDGEVEAKKLTVYGSGDYNNANSVEFYNTSTGIKNYIQGNSSSGYLYVDLNKSADPASTAFIIRSSGENIAQFHRTQSGVIETKLYNKVTLDGTPITTTDDVDTAIDKKLAIKDKLIEKLSERLDKLEKKLKKAK